VVLHYCGKERFSEKQIVLMARLFIVAIVAVTYLLSLLEPPVFTMGLWCFSSFAGLFPLVFAAVYWRRLTAAGAYASVLATLASWGYLFYQSDFASNSRFAVTVKIPGHPFPTLPVVTIFLCSLAAMIVVSLLTKPPSEKTLARFFPP
jgi:SSS family solute:Na+ symporter